MDESKKSNKLDFEDQEVIVFQKDGVARLHEVVDYMKNKGIKMKHFEKAYELGKYWPLVGGSSVNVRNNYIHIYCTEKDREIIERCTDLKHSNNDDKARPYGFKKLCDSDFIKVVDCLAQNEDNR